jgi:putative CocE/NonD family hydrolase
MPEDVVVCGRPTVRISVSTDAHDADWIVAIEDVFPGGGRSVHLAHGIVRMGFINAVRPGDAASFDIELSPVAHAFLAGHALRLIVASSLWPLYAVNAGTGDYLRASSPRLTMHTVFHQTRLPSRLDLPLRGSKSAFT